MLSSLKVHHKYKSLLKLSRRYSNVSQSGELEGIVGQRVFVGARSVASMKEASKYTKPLVVTDDRMGTMSVFYKFYETYFTNCRRWTNVQPNPTVENVFGIRHAFLTSGADGIVGFGGGGPMDASRAAAFIVAIEKINPDWVAKSPEHVEKLLLNFRSIVNTISSDPKMLEAYNQALPALSLVPTTAGTGSDGGKSAVISMMNGRKLVFGHPSLMAPTVALNPAYTVSMPPKMTAATGVDAMLHSLEAYFVTNAAAYQDGMNDSEIAVTDDYAIKGLKLILENLPKVLKDPENLEARQQMQIAALYGAKAFRKADLGAVHATAHTIGALHHLHHGEAIARMAVPVFKYNEARASAETAAKFETVKKIFNDYGFQGKTLAEATSSFLSTMDLPYGLEGLKHNNDWATMAEIASQDGCATNPVKLTVEDYKNIFIDAASKKSL